MIINLIVHGNPKGDRCPQTKSLFVESRILQALKEMYFAFLVSFLQGPDFIATADWWTEMPEAVLPQNWVQTELKVRWLRPSSLEESYFEVFFSLN